MSLQVLYCRQWDSLDDFACVWLLRICVCIYICEQLVFFCMWLTMQSYLCDCGLLSCVWLVYVSVCMYVIRFNVCTTSITICTISKHYWIVSIVVRLDFSQTRVLSVGWCSWWFDNHVDCVICCPLLLEYMSCTLMNFDNLIERNWIYGE